MSKFKRGITNPAFIDALNAERKNPDCYWSRMVADKDLFIAIRENYINVYFMGNSICKLSYENGSLIASVHYKYLLKPDAKPVYEQAKDGKFSSDVLADRTITSLADLDLIKRASKVYAGDEKAGVHSIVTGQKNVLDVEITFSRENDPDKRKTDRIDYLTLEQESPGSDITLVFYEAKHFTNPEIRAEGSPKVLKQIAAYEKALDKHKSDILTSYVCVAKNLVDLGLAGKNRPLIDSLVKSEKPPVIDFKPTLVIFGFDRDQQMGRMKAHKDKLEKVLGRDRLITIGKAK